MLPEIETDWNNHSESIQCSLVEVVLLMNKVFSPTHPQRERDHVTSSIRIYKTNRKAHSAAASRHAWLQAGLTGDVEASSETGYSTLGSVSEYSTREVLKKSNEDLTAY